MRFKEVFDDEVQRLSRAIYGPPSPSSIVRENIVALVASMGAKNLSAAARAIGVTPMWLNSVHMRSWDMTVGLDRSDSHMMRPTTKANLQRIADYFGISYESLWGQRGM